MTPEPRISVNCSLNGDVMTQKPPARVYLIRHGRPAGQWGGDVEDPGLDELGVNQARAVADGIMALPLDERPIFVVSSPLRRCRETAAPLAALLGVEVLIDPDVGEIPTPGHLTRAARPAWLKQAMAGRWGEVKGDLDYEQWRRVVTAATARSRTAIFTHFVAINAVVSRLAGHDRVIDFHPGHASVTVLDLDGEGLRLRTRGAEAATGVL